MTDENDEVLWITVENGCEQSLEMIKNTLAESPLADEYEIIITDDGVETIDIDELKEVLEQ
jgi:hypothetical protein